MDQTSTSGVGDERREGRGWRGEGRGGGKEKEAVGHLSVPCPSPLYIPPTHCPGFCYETHPGLKCGIFKVPPRHSPLQCPTTDRWQGGDKNALSIFTDWHVVLFLSMDHIAEGSFALGVQLVQHCHFLVQERAA